MRIQTVCGMHDTMRKRAPSGHIGQLVLVCVTEKERKLEIIYYYCCWCVVHLCVCVCVENPRAIPDKFFSAFRLGSGNC